MFTLIYWSKQNEANKNPFSGTKMQREENVWYPTTEATQTELLSIIISDSQGKKEERKTRSRMYHFIVPWSLLK